MEDTSNYSNFKVVKEHFTTSEPVQKHSGGNDKFKSNSKEDLFKKPLGSQSSKQKQKTKQRADYASSLQSSEVSEPRQAIVLPEFKKEIKEMSYSDKFKAFFSNATYNMNSKKIKFNSKQNSAYLLGQTYTFNPAKPNESLQKFLRHHEQIIWFSYRNNFPLIRDIFDEKQSSSNDYGWGCMIRCSQMLLAETLKRHYEDELEISLHSITEDFQRPFLKKIINLFLDCAISDSDNANQANIYSSFSIQSVCNRALLQQYQQNVKTWYTSIKVCSIFQEILEDDINIGSQIPLKIVNLTDSVIFIKELQSIALQDQSNRSSSLQFFDSSKQDGSEIDKQRESKEEVKTSILKEDPRQSQRSSNLLVLLHMKFGMEKFDILYKQYFIDLMQIPNFIGALSGTQAKGMYIVGYQDDYVIVFDPHFVQESTNGFEGLEKDYQTYFSKQPKCLGIGQLSSDISIGFFISTSNKDGIEQFLNSINELNSKYEEPLLSVLQEREEVKDDQEEEPQWPEKDEIMKNEVIKKDELQQSWDDEEMMGSNENGEIRALKKSKSKNNLLEGNENENEKVLQASELDINNLQNRKESIDYEVIS